MKEIRILQIIPSLSQANGVASYISEYFQHMDKKNIDMTFLVLNNKNHDRYAEIEGNGGKVFELYREKNIFKYLKKIDDFYKNKSFDIVHCHVPNYGSIFLYYAKKNKVPVRILHSHVNKSSDKFFNRIRNDIISPIAVKNANYYLACSEDAGKFLFKKKKFVVINNAISIDKYKFDLNKRNKIRKKFNLKDSFVIGEFGRLCGQKNQLFMLDIFNEIIKVKTNSILLLAGNGPLENEIKDKIKKLNLCEKVMLLGSRNDLQDLYNALDVFVLPSTYEGLGIVLIEAQANGLNCFTSLDLVPQTANLSCLMHYIKLNNNPIEWAQKIVSSKNDRFDVCKKIISSGYDIEKESDKLKDLYIKYINEVRDKRRD